MMQLTLWMPTPRRFPKSEVFLPETKVFRLAPGGIADICDGTQIVDRFMMKITVVLTCILDSQNHDKFTTLGSSGLRFDNTALHTDSYDHGQAQGRQKRRAMGGVKRSFKFCSFCHSKYISLSLGKTQLRCLVALHTNNAKVNYST